MCHAHVGDLVAPNKLLCAVLAVFVVLSWRLETNIAEVGKAHATTDCRHGRLGHNASESHACDPIWVL